MRILIRKRLVQMLLITIILSIILYGISWVCIKLMYDRAIEMYGNRNYVQALELFKELGQYKESALYKEELVSVLQEKPKDESTISAPVDTEDIWEDESPIYLVATSDSAGMFDLASLKSDESTDAPSYKENETIATDAVNGKDYTVSDIADKRIILFYQENGYNVFFLGQINQEGQWDGSCLVNAYRDGVLKNTTLATYESGKKIDYEQVFFENGMCIYNNRMCSEEGNFGDTWEYEFEVPIEQVISKETPAIQDFFYPGTIKDNISTCLIKRYHGMTSKGYFEDSSGNAYLISYYDDGTIKTFYCGGFKLGKYDDNSGKAWYITSDKYNDIGYMYFGGKFKSGYPDHDGNFEEFIKDVTISEVNDIVGNSSYSGILNWDMEYMAK